MKIFLDVGAHTGETLQAALDPAYGFNRIVCFEPVEACCRELVKVRDPRVVVLQAGLWNKTCERPIYSPGELWASIFADKRFVTSEQYEMARFVRATDWFRDNIDPADQVFMKLNCEGSECDVLDDLMDSGEIRRVESSFVHFDVHEVPTQAHRENEVRERLAQMGIDYVVGPEVLPRDWTHVAMVQWWLDRSGARVLVPSMGIRIRSRAVRLRYRTLPVIVRTARLGRVARALLPKRLYTSIRARLRGYRFDPPNRRAGTRGQGH